MRVAKKSTVFAKVTDICGQTTLQERPRHESPGSSAKMYSCRASSMISAAGIISFVSCALSYGRKRLVRLGYGVCGRAVVSSLPRNPVLFDEAGIDVTHRRNGAVLDQSGRTCVESSPPVSRRIGSRHRRYAPAPIAGHHTLK